MKVRAIVARPGEKAVVEEIVPGYESLEQIVGGELDFCTPIMNDVVVICDKKGKQSGKMPNRFYFGDLSQAFIQDGQEVDVFAGTIVILGLRDGTEKLAGLTESEIDLFMDIYGKPQFQTDWELGGDGNE